MTCDVARIVDVARRAGVSTATVSRTLNGGNVRPELAAAVREAVEALGYTPDRTARSLRRRHADVIGLVLPDVENPFFTAVARGVEDVAAVAGYSVVLCNTDDVEAKEARYLQVAADERWAGVILAAAGEHPQIEGLLAAGRVVVAIDRTVAGPVDHVIFDNENLGRVATRTLLAGGARRIACVTGPSTTSTAVARAEGWRLAMSEAGAASEDGLLVFASFRVDGGRDAVTNLMNRDHLDGVVATNNLVGVGVLRALAERGVRDVRVAVIGDLPFLTADVEGLSIVNLNPRSMGAAAARMLLQRLDGLDAPPRHVIQPTASA